MYIKKCPRSARLVLGAAAAYLVMFGNVMAKDHIVEVSVPINSKGLDLSQPADAQTFYARLKNAAWMVCTRGTRADLLPADDVSGCYEKALGDAVRATRKPMVTLVYLSTHTLQQAVAYGIDLPAEVAAK